MSSTWLHNHPFCVIVIEAVEENNKVTSKPDGILVTLVLYTGQICPTMVLEDCCVAVGPLTLPLTDGPAFLQGNDDGMRKSREEE